MKYRFVFLLSFSRLTQIEYQNITIACDNYSHMELEGKMLNPYQTLNISPNATDEEITKAYRTLAKKYHPDLHPDDPLAERKMKEINQAYDQVQSIRNGSNFDYQYSGYQSSQTNLSSIEILLTERRYQEAWMMLCQITERTSRWYFLSSIAHAGLGDLSQAKYDILEALKMEPYNQEYRFFDSQLNRRTSTSYSKTGIKIPWIFKLIFYIYLFQFLGRLISTWLFS